MGYRLRQIAAESKFSSELRMEAIGQAVPISEIKAALAETMGEEVRERKLTMVVTVLLTIAMNIYTHLSLGAVLGQIAQGLLWMPASGPIVPVNGSAAFGCCVR